jgi:hypothetical protein
VTKAAVVWRTRCFAPATFCRWKAAWRFLRAAVA